MPFLCMNPVVGRFMSKIDGFGWFAAHRVCRRDSEGAGSESDGLLQGALGRGGARGIRDDRLRASAHLREDGSAPRRQLPRSRRDGHAEAAHDPLRLSQAGSRRRCFRLRLSAFQTGPGRSWFSGGEGFRGAVRSGTGGVLGGDGARRSSGPGGRTPDREKAARSLDPFIRLGASRAILHSGWR